MENTGCGNTEHRGPDCHLAQINLRKGAGGHSLLCDGSLKRACRTQGLSKNAQLQATVNYRYCLCS
jgi:hypothetical protein